MIVLKLNAIIEGLSMKRKKQIIAAAIIVVLIVVLRPMLIQNSSTGSVTGGGVDRVVTRIVDGDTIVVEGGDRVRLLDIDTPEKGQSCYTEAKNRLAELIDNKVVSLIKGKEDKDVYGRLLRYVFYNGTNINLLLVREGWANLYFYNKDTPYYNDFIEAEQLAKGEGLCVWQ